MESKFLDQDVDVVSLANKGIVIGCFVGRNYNKILMETGKLTDNIRVTKNGLGSGVDRMFQSKYSMSFIRYFLILNFIRKDYTLKFKMQTFKIKDYFLNVKFSSLKFKIFFIQ